ncbi:MAG: hypothetical protein A2169_02360 [Deltaproteobacteria bacterium RBG_13_47_9]|nr:MAG: hypothetical protein A2169_02360 [Deltaproteobacteria bacterium RBG_13_47_9]
MILKYLRFIERFWNMDFKLRTPRLPDGQANPELRTVFPRNSSLDEILVQLTVDGFPSVPGKVLVRGEGAGAISSYVAGWMAGQGTDIILLDGANRFDPYMVSTFSRRALIPPEKLLKKIQIARAFTCYQMAILIGEKLPLFLEREAMRFQTRKPWVILLGPVTPFLDEDVPEREVRPLFERSLKKMEEMALGGVPFLLFQPPLSSNSKRVDLMRRLIQFSNWVWKISLDDQGTKMVLEKGLIKYPGIKDLGHQMINPR